MQKIMVKTFVSAVQVFKNNENEKAVKIFLDGIVGKENFLESLPPVDLTGRL